MSPTELLQQVTQAKTVILVAPPLELLQKISEGQDKELLSHLMVRSILWRKDVRLYLDFEPPRFRRNTFLEGVASAIDTLHDMGVMVHPYYTGDAAKVMGESLVTEADVLAAAQRADKTISCRAGAIITPAARDALAVCDVTIHYINDYVSGSKYLSGDTGVFAERYNTYKCEGLPAGPITNPGLAAIEAALYPAETDYYYFVTDSDWNYYYASTYAQHKANCNKVGLAG